MTEISTRRSEIRENLLPETYRVLLLVLGVQWKGNYTGLKHFSPLLCQGLYIQPEVLVDPLDLTFLK